MNNDGDQDGTFDGRKEVSPFCSPGDKTSDCNDHQSRLLRLSEPAKQVMAGIVSKKRGTKVFPEYGENRSLMSIIFIYTL